MLAAVASAVAVAASRRDVRCRARRQPAPARSTATSDGPGRHRVAVVSVAQARLVSAIGDPPYQLLGDRLGRLPLLVGPLAHERVEQRLHLRRSFVAAAQHRREQPLCGRFDDVHDDACHDVGCRRVRPRILDCESLQQLGGLGRRLLQALVPRPLRQRVERAARDRIGEQLDVESAAHQLRREHRPAQRVELAPVDRSRRGGGAGCGRLGSTCGRARRARDGRRAADPDRCRAGPRAS